VVEEVVVAELDGWCTSMSWSWGELELPSYSTVLARKCTSHCAMGFASGSGVFGTIILLTTIRYGA